MLTLLLICVAVIAILQFVFRCIYFFLVWSYSSAHNYISENRKKPPIPPKPAFILKQSRDATGDSGPKKEEEKEIVRNFVFKAENGNSPAAPEENSKPFVAVEPRVEVNGSKLLEVPLKKPGNHLAKEESLDSAEEEICCTNFTSLIKQRARGFTHPYTPARSRTPPAKPPKPSPEAIARARNRNSSFGDDIPAGTEGFRYVDDESTESSVDYKDIIFDHGRVVAIELKEKPFTNEEKFELMLRGLTPSPPASPRYNSPVPPQINIQSYDEDDVFVPSYREPSPITPEREIKKPKSNVSFGTVDTRHSWPATKRKKRVFKGIKKIPPARPPPPHFEGKMVSFSDDETSFRRREDHLLLSKKPKPPRPPPPKTDDEFVSCELPTEKAKPIILPHRPPRKCRFRSRTVELSKSSWQPDLPEVDRRRTLSLSSQDNADKEMKKDKAAALKALYTKINKPAADSTLSSTVSDQKAHDHKKFQFRPLPAPPPPPRTHTKKDLSKSPTPAVDKPESVNEEPLQLPVKQKQLNRPLSHKAEIKKKDRPKSIFYSDLDVSIATLEFEPRESLSPMPRELSPGRTDDLEYGGHAGDVDSSLNSSRQASVERSNSSISAIVWSSKYQKNSSNRNSSNRNSVFYCDFPDGAEQQSQPDEKSSFQEKSVQTSPELSAVSDQAAEEGDSDELMDIANNIRKELNTILLRHQTGQRPAPVYKQPSDSESSSNSLHSPSKSQRKVSTYSARSSEDGFSSEDSQEEGEDEVDGQATSPEDKKERKIYFIAKEIMTSEEKFVDALKLLNVGFQGAVRKASHERGAPIVPEEVMNTIFRYLPQLQHLNENLLGEIKERLANWESTKKVSDVLVKIGPFLKLYSCYIRDFENLTVFLDESCRKYPHFAQTVKEFELSPQCQKLALKHYYLKPVQRVPQYRLLLQDYLNHLRSDSPDYEDTVKALKIVSEVADHANETMKQGDNFLKLVSIQNSLLTRHEIVKPGRIFLKEGELMKLSRKVLQPRWFVLFNDSMLYLTAVQHGLFRVNHELPLTAMKVFVPKQAGYANEFSIISVTRSFSLAAKSPEEREEWISLLNHAIDENAVKRSSFINMQIQQQSLSKVSELDLGIRAPVWIPDSRVTMCQLCTTEFTITYRRHHCRACGRVVCSFCSANRVGLKYLSFRSVRVCNACYNKMREVYDPGIESATSSLGVSEENSHRPLSEPNRTFEEPKGGSAGLSRSESDSSDSRTPVRFLKNNKETGSAGRKKKDLPSVLKEVRANDQGSDISGYLHLFTRKVWKRYWFVLKSKILYTYKASEDVAALRSTPLLGFELIPHESGQASVEGIEGNLTFKLAHNSHPAMLFYAETPGFAERWITAMSKATILE